MAQLIDGKAIASKVRAEVAVEAAALRARGVIPGLAVVLVGDDPASRSYVSSKSKAAHEAGIAVSEKLLPATTAQAELLALVDELNRDRAVDAILVQLPLPPAIAPQAIIDAIAPHKDVDGLHPLNLGLLYAGRPQIVPCTPAGIMRLLAEASTPLVGAEAVVVGRSPLVGRPTAALLLNAGATVTICHSQTRDVAAAVRRADILVAAAGRAELIKGDWIKPGATVIDVGNHRGADGKLVGDVEHAAAAARARAITPVPGGVGPMTVAQLLYNTVRSAAARIS